MALVPHSRARLDLSGPWQLAFDLGGEGIRDGWMAGSWPEARSDRVQVPAIWNITHPDAEGVGFYRKAFTIPADWRGEVLQLRFGGVSYRAEVWLNGVYVGSHEGAYTPFRFDVTSLARAGAENQLVVRVAALCKTEDVDGMVLRESPASKQSWYYTHGGLWGAVYLEALPRTHCQSVVVEPDLYREMVLVEVAAGNGYVESRPVDLHLQIARPDGSLAAEECSHVVVPPGTPHFTYRIPLPRPQLWSCQEPNLYQLRVGVGERGEQVDSRVIPFGVREFTVQDGQFFLNGEPIFLRGVLLQPNYPVTLVTPPTREMMVREITLAKEGGFNLIRAHIRPTPPGYLDLTDRMGMLVYAESCLAWIKDSPRLLDHGRREIRALIQRDRNHPSVVFWGIHNENRAASALISEPLIRFVRALDPTRVVVDNSGGSMAIDQDFGWVDRTTVVPSRSTERQEIRDLHVYVGAPIPPPVYEWMRTLGISDLPLDVAAHDFGSSAMLDEWNRELRSYRGKVFVSELGCGGMADLDEVVAGYGDQGHLCDAQEMKSFRDSLHQGFEARHLDRVFGSVRDLIQATQASQAAGLTRQIEPLVANPRVSGYIVTQLNDVAWEFHAGVLDPWRNPKPVYHALKRLTRPHCVVLKAATPVVTCGDRVDVALTLVSQDPLQGEERVCVTVRDPAGEEIETCLQPAVRGGGIRELGNISVATGRAAGEYRVSARLVSDRETLAESSEPILTLPRMDLAEIAASVKAWGETPRAIAIQETGRTAIARKADASEHGPRVLLAANPASLTGTDWDGLLDAVEMGRVAIIGPLHRRDEIARRLLNGRGVNIQLHLGIGNWMGCFHWVPDSELFAGLPAGGLAGEVYVDVLPWYVMSELGGEVFAGSVRNTQTRREPPAMLWYSDVEAIRLGKGALFFCQYRVFEQADANPLAARFVSNLVQLAQAYL
jgi:beta-galactosidase